MFEEPRQPLVETGQALDQILIEHFRGNQRQQTDERAGF